MGKSPHKPKQSVISGAYEPLFHVTAGQLMQAAHRLLAHALLGYSTVRETTHSDMRAPLNTGFLVVSYMCAVSQ